MAFQSGRVHPSFLDLHSQLFLKITGQLFCRASLVRVGVHFSSWLDLDLCLFGSSITELMLCSCILSGKAHICRYCWHFEHLIRLLSAGFLLVKLIIFPLMSLLWGESRKLLNISLSTDFSVCSFVGSSLVGCNLFLFILKFKIFELIPGLTCGNPLMRLLCLQAHLCHSLSISLFSDTTACFIRLILYFSCSSHKVNHFFKVPWSLLVENSS